MAQTPSLQPLEGLVDECLVRRRVRQHGGHLIEEGLGLESGFCSHNPPLLYPTTQDLANSRSPTTLHTAPRALPTVAVARCNAAALDANAD